MRTESSHAPDIQVLLCDHRELTQSWSHENVFNSCWFLYWNSTPGAFIVVNGERRDLEPGHFCLISPETVFSTGMERPFKHFYLHFTAGAPFDQIKSRVFFFPYDEIVGGQVGLIMDLLPDLVMSAVRLSLLAHAVACCLLAKIGAGEFRTLKKLDPRVEKAIDTISKNTSTIIPNESLAEEAGMSVNGFIRLFCKELGVTPQKYSKRKRVEKASILLHFTEKRIDEIALETGFLDRYHFSRAFKEITNYSPAEFRKRQISFLSPQ